MAFYGRKKKKGTAVRLTGLFKTKTRGLCVGSVEELGEFTDVVKRAIKAEKGLVFFLWRNEPEEGKPPFTLSVDVSQDMESASQSRRRAIQQPDEVEEDDDEDYLDSKVPKGKKPKDDDDEVPF